MTSINTYDPAWFPEWWADPPLPIVALVVGTLNLLEEAADLPQPVYVTVSSTQSIDLQFPAARSSYRSITRWALRFGGVLTSKRVKDDSTGRRTLCQAEFGYHAIRAEAYAIIPADTTV